MQVVFELSKLLTRRRERPAGLTALDAAGVLAGMLVMHATGLVVPA